MLLNVLFPNRCLHCNRIIPGDDLVCELCYDQIHFTHWDYYAENPLKAKCKMLFPLENAFALMQFEKESLSRKIIHTLKYGNREIIGKIVANWVVQFIEFETEKPNLLVSVPLHPGKERKRGYNQLHLFTETLSKHYQIPFDHQILKRNFDKKSQASRKTKAERATSENIFSLNQPIENQHILLVDDVFTTGNTMSSVAWEILKSGNNKVSVLVMAMD